VLCTRCSNPVRPIIAIDIDGTIGRYYQHFHDFAQEYLDQILPADYDGIGDFGDYMGLEKNLYREIKLAYRQGGLKRTMPVYDGASEMTLRIIRAGAELWIATTRPWMRLDNIDPDTKYWLSKNNIYYDGLMYGDDKYYQLAHAVSRERVIGVLEDLPELFDVAKGLFPEAPIFRSTKFNKGDQRFPQVKTLRDAREEFLDRIERWHELAGS
jgi:5'(3')-deoxyribonucleotidase